MSATSGSTTTIFSIGRTPLVRLRKRAATPVRRARQDRRAHPAYSVKCASSAMVWDAETKGCSARQGISRRRAGTPHRLASPPASRGIECVLTMRRNEHGAPQVLVALAQARVTPGPLGMKAHRQAETMLAEQPDRYCRCASSKTLPTRSTNHHRTEIWEDTAETSKCSAASAPAEPSPRQPFIKAPRVTVGPVAVEPRHSPVITQTRAASRSRLHAQDQGSVRGSFRRTSTSRSVDASSSSPTTSHHMARRLMREEGILCGISCGARRTSRSPRPGRAYRQDHRRHSPRRRRALSHGPLFEACSTRSSE